MPTTHPSSVGAVVSVVPSVVVVAAVVPVASVVAVVVSAPSPPQAAIIIAITAISARFRRLNIFMFLPCIISISSQNETREL
jgi:flagellar biosynthesis protein FlhB